MRTLEQQRQQLAARSDAQRRELIACASAAGESLRRLRLILSIARTTARLQRFWNQIRG